jgi:hypothetical protein
MGDQNRSQTPDHEAGTTSETPNLSTDNNKEINLKCTYFGEHKPKHGPNGLSPGKNVPCSLVYRRQKPTGQKTKVALSASV